MLNQPINDLITMQVARIQNDGTLKISVAQPLIHEEGKADGNY